MLITFGICSAIRDMSQLHDIKRTPPLFSQFSASAMALRHIISVVAIFIQLLGLTQGVIPLPQLGKDGLTNKDNPKIPTIGCYSTNKFKEYQATLGRVLKPSEAFIPAIFRNYAFTSHLVAYPGTNAPKNGVGKFQLVEVKRAEDRTGERTLYALQVVVGAKAVGENAYWVQQGRTNVKPYPYIDIPRHPAADQPKFVFTSDFSGCAWTVTPLPGGTHLRLRHVSGGQENPQFNNLSEKEKGGSVSYALQFMDYGVSKVGIDGHLERNVCSMAYMHYSGGRWTLNIQREACNPYFQQKTFKDGVLKSATLSEKENNLYASTPILTTEAYSIP